MYRSLLLTGRFKMKTFLFILITLITILTAKAETELQPLTSNLMHFNLSQGHFDALSEGGLNDLSGTITVDPHLKIIKLQLNSITCPVSLALPSCQVQPITEIELPLVEIKSNVGCSGVKYLAQKDLRPVDGNFEQIVVTDYSQIECRIIVPQDQMTRVKIKTITSGFSPEGVATFESVIVGDRLK